MAESNSIEVGRTAWEMAEFEIHYLRGALTSMLNWAVVAERNPAQRRPLLRMLRHQHREYELAMMRALQDPEYRNQQPGRLG